MTALLPAYLPVIAAMVGFGLLVLIQFLILDVSQIRHRHVPGTPVLGGHDDFLFRASRAHANSTENLGLFLLLALSAMLLGSDPQATAIAAWSFTAARFGHMACYYADWRLARSAAFALGLLATLGLLVLCLIALGRQAG